jgi:hypothetical protein
MSIATAPPAERLSTLPPGVPELTLGYQAAAWAEGKLPEFSGLVQPNGPKAKKPFRFTPGQIRFLLWWYAVDESGEWLFNHGVRRLSKGSGKSPFAAALALTEFCGPVRLKDFDDRWPGGCVGKAVDMPLVQIAATAESQTANTMRMVRAFAPKGSVVAQTYQLDVGKTKYYKLPEGTLEVITSSPTAAEGGEGSLVVADETEHWKPSNGGVELASTLEDNLAKSGSRMLETSNAWIPGLETVSQDSWESWLSQEEGLTKGEQRILYDAVIAPPDTDMADRASLTAALEHVYADCPWVNISAIRERIWSPKAKPDESKRKYLNWPTVTEDAWVTPQEWSNCLHPEIRAALERQEAPPRIVEDEAEVVLFFDGSKSRDATALIGCDVETGHVFTLAVWEPDPNDDDETVDVADVDRHVSKAFDRYEVLAFFGDVKEWESYVYTEWPQCYQDDLLIWAVPNGKPPRPIAWDMRSHSTEFAKAAEACQADIEEGEFTHDGHPAVARHVGNARRRPHKDYVSIGKESKDSPLKIDAAVCVIGARMVRQIVLGSGKRRKKRSGKAVFIP